jgi:uncharacterized spore protein YtfJ
MLNVEGILDAVGEELGGVANGEAVVGSPLKLGGATVYPISLVSLGLGGGGGEGEETSADGKGQGGTGQGAGGGVKARPVAVLVFQGEEVSVLPIPSKAGPIERFLDRLPDLLEKFKEKGIGKS